MKDIFIHPTALVETDNIGSRSRVWCYAHIMPGASVGNNCNIGDHCFIESGASIGDNTVIKNAVMIWEGVTIENGVFIGPNVTFTNDLYPRSRFMEHALNRYMSKKNWLAPTVVKRGASLGAGAVVVPGITVGEFSMIGAGAVVTRDVPAYALVKGNPARRTGWVCQCGHPLHFDQEDAVCSDCGLRYRWDYNGVRLLKSEAKSKVIKSSMRI